MRWMIAALLVATTACQDSGSKQSPAPAPAPTAKTADDCKLFITKARGTLQRLATSAGVTWEPSMEDAAVADCREDLKAGKRAKLIDCVLSAPSETAVQGCFPRYDELTDKKP